MTVTVSSPQFSFVNFNDDSNACNTGAICLPVSALSDLQFMLYVQVTGSDKADFTGADWAISVSNLVLSIYEREFVPTWVTVATFPGMPTTPDIYMGYFTYNNLHARFDVIEPYDCFTLSLYHYENLFPSGHALVAVATSTTCFYKEPDTCFNTLLQYNNNENAFGFLYEGAPGGYFNSVRLNLYLHSPVNDEQQQVYEKSDGSTQKLMHRIYKDYDFKTDYYPDEIHEKLNVATAHDTVLLTSSLAGLTEQNFVRKEKIEITWHQDEIPRNPLGQAKGKLRLAVARATINNNCQ